MNRSVNFLGTLAATLIFTHGVALARDGQRPRGANAQRAAQPHTRTTDRQRTENGRTRSDTWTGADGRTATRDVEVINDKDAGTRTRNVEYTGPNGNTASVESVRTKTDDGFTRSTTATNAQGETATRDVTVTRDKDAGTITRDAHATAFDGRTTATTDVKQRTEDGYSRDTTHTRTDGSTHTRAVDVTCDKDTGKCDKQVEVDQSP